MTEDLAQSRTVQLPAWAPYLACVLLGVAPGGLAGSLANNRGVDELRVRMEAVQEAMGELKTEVKALRGPSDRAGVERDELRRRVGDLERRSAALEGRATGGGR